ncbi:MAG: hypothetical protein H0U56_07770 [Methylibium sp.]|nr:hypothetical protein [Methylibium sp.]
MTTVQLAPPAVATLNVFDVLPAGTVSTLIGCIGQWDLGFAGRISCVAHLSFGDLPLKANRDTLPLDIRSGDWARLQLMRRHDGSVRLLGSSRIAPPGVEMAWLPTVRHHRFTQLVRLRGLLGRLEPVAQALFVVAMTEARVQGRFLMRIAALDQHCYPGGYFDQSVRAASNAFHAVYTSDRDRSVATLSALFFDIGKVLEPAIGGDLPRLGPSLAPHPRSREVVKKACERIARFDEHLTVDLLAQLSTADWMNRCRDPARDGRIRHVVLKAVSESWRSEFPEDRRWPRPPR